MGGETLYAVVYSVDKRGLRVEPPLAPGHGDRCVLFFGCSYTFGEGVNDAETLPYRTGVLAEGRLRMINFGLHGYGPHQMLAVRAAVRRGRRARAQRTRGQPLLRREPATGRLPLPELERAAGRNTAAQGMPRLG